MSLSLTRTELLQSQFALPPLPETDTERAKNVTLTCAGLPPFVIKIHLTEIQQMLTCVPTKP